MKRLNNLSLRIKLINLKRTKIKEKEKKRKDIAAKNVVISFFLFFNHLLASLIIHSNTSQLVSYLFYVFNLRPQLSHHVDVIPPRVAWISADLFFHDYDDDAVFYTRVVGIDRNAHGISMEQQQVKACGV